VKRQERGCANGRGIFFDRSKFDSCYGWRGGLLICACVPIDMWYYDDMKRYGACTLSEVGSPRRGDRAARTHPGRLGEASLPSVADAFLIINSYYCVPTYMWYRKRMKRYGACSLREGGLSFGRPAPLQFGPAGAEGRVVEPMQVVAFHDICGYFHRPRGIRLLLWPVLESPASAYASR
jgi:hypothetical protein